MVENLVNNLPLLLESALLNFVFLPLPRGIYIPLIIAAPVTIPATTAHIFRCRLTTLILCSIDLICFVNISKDPACLFNVSSAFSNEISAIINFSRVFCS